ncbi:MAG: cardiolipin synthase, partial [Desulfitobacterium sp.]|nr:cardiolipin synthase [Desulfitobacterium sp.]
MKNLPMFYRVVFIALLLILQFSSFVVIIWRFSNFFIYFYFTCTILSIVALLTILNSKSNPAYKIAWIIPILLFPIFGGLFYLMFGRNKLSKRQKRKMKKIDEKMEQVLVQDPQVMEELAEENLGAANLARYIEKYSLCPIYQNNYTEYFPLGEEMYERLLEELRKAEEFIFLEYFIIDEGKVWDSILEILKEKAQQGLDVRVIYDDVGSLFKLPYGYDKKLRAMGIKCQIFNRLIPVLTTRMNNRDHRKIAVIDGKVAFTGGINLADEYINAYDRFGHWKDTAIMIRGEAVWNFTVMFLSLWDYEARITEDYTNFKANHETTAIQEKHPGFVQPFGDSPLDEETIGETIYLTLMGKAQHYIYINTPYLILSNEMITALTAAAKRSVDVRIVTPYRGDRWFVHSMTRSSYQILVESGVKIYEYSPGFMHAKSMVIDDVHAIVGTINMDYRSLYLHFECGVYLYGTESVLDVKKDYLETLTKSQEVTLEDCYAVKWYKKAGRTI